MVAKQREIPLDPEIIMGIQAGYLRQADAQWHRHVDQGLDPPITEESDHNAFLWKKVLFPGLARHVAAKLDKQQYWERVRYLAHAVVAAVMEDKPTVHAIAKAFGKKRWDDQARRKVQRMMTEYLPDTLQRTEDTGRDGREQGYATAFDPIPGAGLPPPGTVPPIDPGFWKTAPFQRFRGPHDQALVSASLLAAHPEYLRFWVLVQRSINQALHDAYRHRSSESAYQTLRHPLCVSMLANHAIAICADSWWSKLKPQTQQGLLATPRIFAYDEGAVEEAVRHWNELSTLHEEWPYMGFHWLNDAALGLRRWGEPACGARLMAEAGSLKRLPPAQAGNLLANAGIMYREAGIPERFEQCLREALPLLDAAVPRLQLVSRINYAEALGGPVNSEAREQLRLARDLAGNDPNLQQTLWWNLATASQRLGLIEHEEAAWAAWQDLPGTKDDRMSAHALNRLMVLMSANLRLKPVRPEEFFAA